MLTIKNLCKQYNAVSVISDLNLQITTGEIYCLLGHNGAGKSTTLNLILGFLTADSGEIMLDGKPLFEDKNYRNYLSYVPDEIALYENLSGYHNLKLFTDLTGQKLPKEEAIKLLQLVGLPESAFSQKITKYSKGMRQKVAIAIALAKKAKIIIMDEPTNGLDPNSVENLTQLCKEISKQNISFLITTHDLFFAKEVSNQIGILQNGKIIDELETKTQNLESIQELFTQKKNKK